MQVFEKEKRNVLMIQSNIYVKKQETTLSMTEIRKSIWLAKDVLKLISELNGELSLQTKKSRLDLFVLQWIRRLV